jgi:pyruvate dehydrogenase E1 component alpha subunit
MHVANLKQYNLGANGIVGGGIPIAVGAALSIKLDGSSQVVACFFSDGAVNNGVFHESINLAAIYDLPVVFVLENNGYAANNPVGEMNRNADLSKYGEAYGIPGVSLDGNDALVVYEATKEAAALARAGKGPTLLECKTYRHSGHHVNDNGAYMPQDVLAEWKKRDPLIILKDRLEKAGVGEEEIEVLNQRIEMEIDEALTFALESEEPSPEKFLAEISTL